jgi:hypothetical protein
MRLALTVMSPGAQRTADVVLEADPATPVAHIAGQVAVFAGGGWTEQGPASIIVGAPAGERVLRFPDPGTRGSLGAASPDSAQPWAIPLYVGGRRVPPS